MTTHQKGELFYTQEVKQLLFRVTQCNNSLNQPDTQHNQGTSNNNQLFTLHNHNNQLVTLHNRGSSLNNQPATHHNLSQGTSHLNNHSNKAMHLQLHKATWNHHLLIQKETQGLGHHHGRKCRLCYSVEIVLQCWDSVQW